MDPTQIPPPGAGKGGEVTPYLAHEGGQPGIGGTVVGAEPELRVVIRCHGKLEIPCGEPRRGSPPRRDTGSLVAKTRSWCLVARWGNRDGATPDPVSRLCPGWDQGFASLPSHRGKRLGSRRTLLPRSQDLGTVPKSLSVLLWPGRARTQRPHVAAWGKRMVTHHP